MRSLFPSSFRNESLLISEEARAFHREYPAIDLHADTLMWARWVDYDLLVKHNAPLPRAALGGHVDVPRLYEGGIGAQFFGLVSLPISAKGCRTVIDAQIDRLEQTCARSMHTERPLLLGTSATDIELANKQGAITALLGIEGAHALEGDLEALTHFAKRRVRYLGLVHFRANEAAFPAYGWGRRDAMGLTLWGQALVRKCEDEHVIVDLAHINRKGWLEACAMANKPMYCSHTGVAGAFQHWRNVDDDQLRALAHNHGALGLIFVPKFLGADSLAAIVRHLQHVINVGGEDLPALGSDWDGFVVPTRELQSPSQLPALTTALLKHGFSERQIRKILRDNALRVLHATD